MYNVYTRRTHTAPVKTHTHTHSWQSTVTSEAAERFHINDMPPPSPPLTTTPTTTSTTRTNICLSSSHERHPRPYRASALTAPTTHTHTHSPLIRMHTCSHTGVPPAGFHTEFMDVCALLCIFGWVFGRARIVWMRWRETWTWAEKMGLPPDSE